MPNGQTAKGQTAKGQMAKGQIAKGQTAKGQQPRHGIRHINGEHKVKTVNPPLTANKGTEQGIKHKHKGLIQSQSIQIRGGHMHSQHEPMKWIGSIIVSMHMHGICEIKGIIVEE